MRLSVACKVLLVTSAVLVAVPPSATVVSGFQPPRHADVMFGSQSPAPAAIRTSVQGLQAPSALHAKLGDLFGSEDVTGKEKKKREPAEKAKAEQEAKAQQRAAKEKARTQTSEARKKAGQQSGAQKEKAEAKSKSNKAKEESKKPASNAPSTGGIDLSKPINSLIVPLAPVAAIGAGRAYLTRREKLEEERKRVIEEKERDERELARRLAEIESKKDANGVSRLEHRLADFVSNQLYVCRMA